MAQNSAGLEVSLSDESVLAPASVPESCVAPRVPWKNRTAGFHRTDVSVPTEVLDWLDRESIRKRKEKEDGWGVGTVSSAQPTLFPNLPWASSAA